MKKLVLLSVMLVGCLYADLLDLKYEKVCDNSKKDCQIPIPNQLKWNIKTLSFDNIADLNSSDKQDDNKSTTHKDEKK